MLKSKKKSSKKSSKKLKTRGAPKTIRQLIKKADFWFSRRIRLRDSERVGNDWVGQCIDCGRKVVVMKDGHWTTSANAGHYVSRGHFILRYDEENVNLQSSTCNLFKDKITMIDGYRNGLDMKYGTGTGRRLSKIGTALHKFTCEELEEIIADSRTEVAFYLKNEYPK